MHMKRLGDDEGRTPSSHKDGRSTRATKLEVRVDETDETDETGKGRNLETEKP